MPSRKKPRRVWAPGGRRPKPPIPDTLKERVQAEADRLLEEFRPVYVRPPPESALLNYLTALHSTWFRGYLYLCGTHACPHPDAPSPTFESRFTRLEYAGDDRFHLAYMRHTGQWWEVHRDLPMDVAVQTIRTEQLFHP